MEAEISGGWPASTGGLTGGWPINTVGGGGAKNVATGSKGIAFRIASLRSSKSGEDPCVGRTDPNKAGSMMTVGESIAGKLGNGSVRH